MINRAKCKLCKSTIESFHRYDRVECSCGEISVGGDDSDMACSAKNWSNFLRVDDQGNEIIPKILDNCKQNEINKPESLSSLIDHLISDVERMPDHAKISPITHYDYLSVLMLLKKLSLRVES